MPLRIASRVKSIRAWLGERMLTTLTLLFGISCLLVLWNTALLVEQISATSNYKAQLLELELRRVELVEQGARATLDEDASGPRAYEQALSSLKAAIDETLRSLPDDVRNSNLVVKTQLQALGDLVAQLEAGDRQALSALQYGEAQLAQDLYTRQHMRDLRTQLAHVMSRLRHELALELQRRGDAHVRDSALIILTTSLIAIVLVFSYRQRICRQNTTLLAYAHQMKQLALVAQRTTNAVLMTDAQHRITWCNEGFTRIMGYTLAEVQGQSPKMLALSSAVENSHTTPEIAKAVSEQREFHGLIKCPRKDGTFGWMELDCQPIIDDSGHFQGYIGIQSDVTERVEMEQALRDHQLRLEMALLGGDLGFWDWNIETGYVYYSERYQTMLGYEPGDLDDRIETCISLTHPDDLPAKKKRVDDHLEGRIDCFETVARLRRKDGTYAWILSRGRVYSRDLNGKALRVSGTHLDITQRKATEDELARRHAMLENVINGVSDAIIIADFEQKIIMCNNAVKPIFGIGPDQMVGRSIGLLYQDPTRLFNSPLQAPSSPADVISQIIIYTRLDGSHFPGETMTSPLQNQSGQTMGYISVIRDVTSRLKAEDEIRAAKAEAELASRTKSEFLANMSHEIRTPMTAILGYADLLDEAIQQHDSDNQREFVDIIRRNGNHLLQIINDILDLSKIEAGFMQLENIDCNPREMVQDVVNILSARAREKQIALDLRFEGLIPSRIQSDPTRIKQILFNLIGNALKFTQQGGVSITVKTLRDVLREEFLLSYEIHDTGIGMTREQQKSLFKPFTQADSSTTRRFGGTGLGLTIAKRLAEILGGEIQLESQPGLGSTFTLIIAIGLSIHRPASTSPPASSAAVPSIPVAEPATPAQKLQGMQVLLVEDGPDNQRLLSFLLKKAGVVVQLCENGQQAVDLLYPNTGQPRTFDPDVVLMDMQMPVLDGYQATSRLRQLGFENPIIALTAHAMSGDRDKCISAGCDDFLTKPIDKPTLLGKCSRWRGCTMTRVET